MEESERGEEQTKTCNTCAIHSNTPCQFKSICGSDKQHWQTKKKYWPEPRDEEPKTKRVAVIWVGEVDEDIINDKSLSYSLVWNLPDELDGDYISDVDLIDADRVEFVVKNGVTVYTVKRWETISQVMAAMPKRNAFTSKNRYIGAVKKWMPRLEAAEEREV